MFALSGHENTVCSVITQATVRLNYDLSCFAWTNPRPFLSVSIVIRVSSSSVQVQPWNWFAALFRGSWT